MNKKFSFESTYTDGPVNVALIDSRTGTVADLDIPLGDLVQMMHTFKGALTNLELGIVHKQRQTILGDEETSDKWRLHVTTCEDFATLAIWEGGIDGKKLATNSFPLKKLQKRSERAISEVLELQN